ncbi:peptidase T [Bacillus sp. 2205SS5-2]|uniref:peptidase T n=1 Tax=Bacillus sp. 2205SS5-2 TaxID=3109031 RepID=UPI00300493A4
MKEEIIQRFSSYVKVDTQSDENNEHCPSTKGQLTLGNMLVEELNSIGMQEVTMDDNGYVMATLPSNSEKTLPTIGFLAHLDTATDFTGHKVNPQIVENYNGQDILLNKELHIVLSQEDFPSLANYMGQTLITTDGTTLLGADNKAGITEIMTAMEYLIQHPEVKHGTIRVAFTPDEEIGRGPHKFDVDQFNADYAYTIDGGPLGELQYESFNAASAKLTIKGRNVHPGSAKNKMMNSTKIGMEFHSLLPIEEAPEHTSGYEGFYHLSSFEGDVEETKLDYIIRDHNKELFHSRKAKMVEITQELNAQYGKETIQLELNDQYYNMKEKIEPVKEIVDVAYQAMKNLNIEPIVEPIRGGTDGSQLSYMGLPTPNIFTGGENFHGRYEFVSVNHMIEAVKVIVEIARLTEATK